MNLDRVIGQFFSILLLCFCLVLNHNLIAQANNVYGINKDYLVRINLETAKLEPVFKLDLPDGAAARNLVYIPKDTAFYTTVFYDTEPALLKIDHRGLCQLIGQFTVGQHQPYFCKALTYNSNTDQLLLSVSLDSSNAFNDSKAEALVVVDRRNARCQKLATIRQNPPPDDFEEMAVYKNQLFCFDIDLEKEITYVFPFKVNELKGELFSGSKQIIPLFTMEDVMMIDQVVYFTDSRQNQLHYFNLMARKWLKVGQFHGMDDILITGMAVVPLFKV